MNHFCWKCHFLSCVKKKFSEEFHKEARRQYTVHQEAERLKAKIQQLDNANNPSTAGYLPRENHTLKPHDNIRYKNELKSNPRGGKSLQQIEEKVKIDLESAVLSNGKIKAETNVPQVQRGCHFCVDQTQNQASYD